MKTPHLSDLDDLNEDELISLKSSLPSLLKLGIGFDEKEIDSLLKKMQKNKQEKEDIEEASLTVIAKKLIKASKSFQKKGWKFEINIPISCSMKLDCESLAIDIVDYNDPNQFISDFFAITAEVKGNSIPAKAKEMIDDYLYGACPEFFNYLLGEKLNPIYIEVYKLIKIISDLTTEQKSRLPNIIYKEVR